MADEKEDFWPDEIGDADDPEPVALLKEQAALLGGKTRNAVEGVVKTSTERGTAYHSLYLKADALGDYLYKLLCIEYPAIGQKDAYPVTVQSSAGGPSMEILNGDDFRKWLRAQLSSDYVRRAIASLVRHVREAGRSTAIR